MKNFCEDSHYFINKSGEVYSTKSGKLKRLKTQINRKGYEIIKILGKTYKVYRLVAEAYIPNHENKPQVNHKDSNKLNNNDWNLEWCTNSENQIHAWENGLQPKREPVNRSLTQEQADRIREDYMSLNLSQRDLAKKYSVSKTTIADILSGKYYNPNGDIPSLVKNISVKRLTMDQAIEIRNRFNSEKISYNKLGKEFGVDHKTISKIVNNKTYVQ